jgi:hypothetical protein
VKYLYINGDSFCGDGIDVGKTFGELCAKKYDLKIEKDWEGGSSNHRIYRTTVDFVMNNQDILDETLFIIGWSKHTRWEFFNCNTNRYIQLGHSQFFGGGKGIDWEDDYIMEFKFWKGYMSNFYDFRQMKREYIQMVFSLQSILKNYGCNYLFYTTFKDLLITSDCQHIDLNNWILPDISFDGYLNSFKQEDVRMEYNVDFVKVDDIFDDHPNMLGHQKWFEVISSIIDRKNIL